VRVSRVLFLLFPIAFTVNGQETNRDTLHRRLMRDSAIIYRVTNARPYGKLENRRTFFNGSPVNFYGAMVGAILYQRHVVSGGFYALSRESRDPVIVPKEGIYQQLNRASFVNFSYQYILINRRYLQIQLPLEAGYGSYRMRVRHLDDPLVTEEGRFMPMAVGLQFIIRPFTAVGVSLTLGHRFSPIDASALSLSGEYYAFGLWADARQIYRDMRYWKKKRAYRRELARA
jgi:hypothetical protein